MEKICGHEPHQYVQGSAIFPEMRSHPREHSDLGRPIWKSLKFHKIGRVLSINEILQQCCCMGNVLGAQAGLRSAPTGDCLLCLAVSDISGLNSILVILHFLT